MGHTFCRVEGSLQNLTFLRFFFTYYPSESQTLHHESTKTHTCRLKHIFTHMVSDTDQLLLTDLRELFIRINFCVFADDKLVAVNNNNKAEVCQHIDKYSESYLVYTYNIHFS